MKETVEVMKDLGLEQREIKIYLMLIQEGSSTALQISKSVRIDRTTTYDILGRLIDKGIVSSTVKNNTKHFQALKPKELLTYFKDKYSSLERILPELNKIAQQGKEPIKCELFQGINGFKTLIKDVIEAKKDYKVINIRKEFEDVLGYFTSQGIIKLQESKVKETAIVERKAKFKKLKRGAYRYVDKRLLSPVTTVIYGGKVIFFIWTEPYFAVSIESKTLVKAQEEYFEILWKVAYPPKENR